MGLFSRHADVPNGTAHNRHRGDAAGPYGARPGFGEWLRGTGLDILTMAALGAIGLGVYKAPPAPSRSFPITFQDGEIVYPSFAYPLRHEIIPIWASALISALIPMGVVLVFQLRVRSFWDANNGILGVLYSLISAAVFQVFLKWLIGGLRPHFLAVCKPQVQDQDAKGNGFRQIMYDRKVCTGDKKQINDSLESFPSGHSTAAFAGFVFLYLYLNAKLKLFSNHHPALWKLIAVYAPLLGATLIAGTLTVDEFHNWYDCVAGALIGAMMAFSSYRMVYASIWDFRFNHIPLMRGTQFGYALTEGVAEDGVFTRSAGWGTHDGVVGSGNAAGRRQVPMAGGGRGFTGDVAPHAAGNRGGYVV